MEPIDTNEVARWVTEIVREKQAAGERLRAAHGDPETVHLLWAWADSALEMVAREVLAALRQHADATGLFSTSAEAALAETIADGVEAIAELNSEPKLARSQVGESVVFLTAYGASLITGNVPSSEEPF